MSQTFAEFLRQFVTEDRLRRFDDILSFRTRHVTVVLENIFHGHNASACLRTCDCFGVQDVHVVESRNSFQPNQEIALGASKWLTLHRHCDNNSASKQDSIEATAKCISTLRDNGYQILATSPKQNSTAVDSVPLDRKTAVIFGAEQRGVSDTAIQNADGLIHIPMFGFTESFNISVSVAVILHQFTSRLRESDIPWQLNPAERESLLHEWICRTLGEKLEPLQRRFEADPPNA